MPLESWPVEHNSHMRVMVLLIVLQHESCLKTTPLQSVQFKEATSEVPHSSEVLS